MKTPSAGPRRLALVLPANRLWGWHATLIERLARDYSVDTFVAEAPTYPRLLSLWLAIERILFGEHRLLRALDAADVNARPLVAAADLNAYDLVVDLAGSNLAAGRSLSLRYDDSQDEARLFGRLLARRHAVLSIVGPDGDRLASSYSAVENDRALRTALPYVFARSIDLIERVIKAQGPLASRELREQAPTAPTYSSPLLLGFALGIAANGLARLTTKPFVLRDHWELAVRRKGAYAREDGRGYLRVVTDPTSFFADPFFFSIGGKRYLFAEELPYRGRVGKIVVAEMDDAGELSPFEVALAPPHHLSYPFVFEDGGAIYMLPESGNGALDLYVFDPGTRSWRLDTRLMDGPKIADATLFRHEGRYWILGATYGEMTSTWDELSAFHATTLRGPWTPHSANPLISDLRAARPAGCVIRDGGRLYRPAQDCERGYGAAIVWCEILTLNPTEFEERILTRTHPPRRGGYRGVHTYNSDDVFEVIDTRRTLWRLPVWFSRAAGWRPRLSRVPLAE